MAEKHEIVELGSTNRDGKGAAFLAESSSGARGSRFTASVKAMFGSSEEGAVLASESSERSAASSSSVYYSARIERIMRSKTEFASEVDWEIEASKDHWSQLEPRSEESLSDAEDESVQLTNGEIVEGLLRQYPQMSDFFLDGAGYVEVGEKIAEGAQADIFTAKLILSGFGHNGYVLKVFKEGSSMRDLQKQWPLALLNRCRKRRVDANSLCSSAILSGTVVMNGRFAFVMWRCWGDLRKLLDKRMELTSNRYPPLTDWELKKNMWLIARGCRACTRTTLSTETSRHPMCSLITI